MSSWPVGLSLACLRFGCRGKAKKGTERERAWSTEVGSSCTAFRLDADEFTNHRPFRKVPRKCRLILSLFSRILVKKCPCSEEISSCEAAACEKHRITRRALLSSTSPCSSSLCEMPPLRWGSFVRGCGNSSSTSSPLSSAFSFYLSIYFDDDVVYPSLGGFFLHCSATGSGYWEFLTLSVRVSL